MTTLLASHFDEYSFSSRTYQLIITCWLDTEDLQLFKNRIVNECDESLYLLDSRDDIKHTHGEGGTLLRYKCSTEKYMNRTLSKLFQLCEDYGWDDDDLKFVLAYHGSLPRGELGTFGRYEYRDGKCVHHFEETGSDIQRRSMSQMRMLVVNEFQQMVLPSAELCKHGMIDDLQLEILSFLPYFGLTMSVLSALEKAWIDAYNSRYNSRYKTDFAYALVEKVKQKWYSIRDENLHILSLQMILRDHELIESFACLVEQITGFRMQKTEKCKFYGSAKGCKNSEKCRFSHNNPYHTDKCLYFDAINGCMYGDDCYYRHSMSDLEEPDIDCFFDASSSEEEEDEAEEENNEHEVEIGQEVEGQPLQINLVPATYMCFLCKKIGHHWIMNCQQKRRRS